MAAWRMAMRGRIAQDGSWLDEPIEMWPQCREVSVAAITYHPIQDSDFSKYADLTDIPAWHELAPAQKQSLTRFYHMDIGDVLYVKQGPEIVGKGVVEGSY